MHLCGKPSCVPLTPNRAYLNLSQVCNQMWRSQAHKTTGMNYFQLPVFYILSIYFCLYLPVLKIDMKTCAVLPLLTLYVYLYFWYLQAMDTAVDFPR